MRRRLGARSIMSLDFYVPEVKKQFFVFQKTFFSYKVFLQKNFFFESFFAKKFLKNCFFFKKKFLFQIIFFYKFFFSKRQLF